MYINIKAVQLAVESKKTSKQFLGQFIDAGYFPDQVIAELASLIPEAHTGLNAEAVKLICNTIKRCA